MSGATAGQSTGAKKVQLVTCYDVIPEKRKVFSEKYGCDQEKSYEDVIRRDDIDGVLVTSPNLFHAEQAVLAAEHGKHVFCGETDCQYGLRMERRLFRHVKRRVWF